MINDDWEKRQLCSDGNCIGVIGPDGRCKECGLPGEGDPPAMDDAGTDPEDEASLAAEDVDTSTDEDRFDVPAAESDDDDWDNRRLCPDGNCIGVIGPNGRCKECGREAE